MATRLPGKRPLIGGGLALSLMLAGQVALGISSAAAATAFTVTTSADIAANAGACGNASILTPPNPANLSLREAVCLANNNGGVSTINIPVGTYNLTSGEVQVGTHSGQDVTLAGAGAASTTISAGGLSRVLDFDPNLLGGVAGTVSGVTISGGSDSVFGGAGIIAGSANATTADTLAINASVITGNHADGATPSATNLPGGGVQFIGGSLTITNSTISNNTSASSPGSGVVYDATGATAGETLSISGSTFSGNAATNSGGTSVTNGGALDLRGLPSTSYSVTSSTFSNNTVVATTGGAVGAGIRQESGSLTLTGSTFTGNSVSGGTAQSGGAIEVTTGTATITDNRITGNTASAGSGIHVGSGASVTATDDWFGCNGGPGASGCDTVSGPATDSPWLALTGTAVPATVNGPGATSTVTASFTTDSLGNAVASGLLGTFAGLPVTFSNPLPAPSTINGSTSDVPVPIGAGQAAVTYNSQTGSGPGHVLASFDNASVTVPISVNRAPAITTDPASQTVAVGGTAIFNAAASGFPAPTVQWQRSTNGGATFTDIGGATAAPLTFVVTAGDNGDQYRAVFTNVTDISRSATTTAATLTVVEAPAFTSASTATFVVGAAGSVTVTTSGLPTVTSITEPETPPAGLTFTDNGNGTATLAGTPTAGTGGTYTLNLTASNGVAPDGTQSLTVQVNEAPAITLNPTSQTVNPGTPVTFVAAASGVPAPTVQWQVSTNGGGTFTDIAGATNPSLTFTAAAGQDGNEYRAVFTNVVDDAVTTAATLRVGIAPAFTSSATTTFVVGTLGTFAITTSGVPDAAITTAASLPSWLTLTDNGDGTATLSGTPPAGSQGTVSFTLNAVNGFSPPASQSFTLLVDASPIITSADHTTYTVGTAGSFTVQTTAAARVTTVITETGALPADVTFTDNGDGTATLAGTPLAGTAGSYPITITASNGVLPDAVQSFTLTVVKATQSVTITSTPPSPALVGDTYPLAATATSALPVSFSIDAATTNAACSLAGSTVDFDHAGSCVIDANQAGDGTFAAAAQVQQTISVGTVATSVSVVTTPSSSVFGQAVTATATVSAVAGTPAGSVQFAVDGNDLGAPVTVSGGTATSVGLTDSLGQPLAPGSHNVTATFTPDDQVTFAGSQHTVSLVVAQAATNTTLVVNPSTLVATVAAVAPGVGTPTGSVSFTVGGVGVGTATLSGGVATLNHVTPAGMAQHVAAVYAGDIDFSGSSASTSRLDPSITAALSSAHPRTHFGWYRSAVKVTFTCVTNGSPLTAPCPSAVTFTHNGAGQSVTRTITATNGGADTVAVRGINIDKTPPRVHVTGVHDGAVYDGPAPAAHCVATDALSGVASCRITKHTHGTRTTYKATATDKAGNTATVRGSYRTLGISIQGARFRHGAFNVRLGHAYTLVAHAVTQPTYFDAAPYPMTPFQRDLTMFPGGHNRWVLGLTFRADLRGHQKWNLGVKVGHTLHVIRIRIFPFP